MAPSALKVLRELSPAAKNMPLAELAKMIVSGRSFELGLVIELQTGSYATGAGGCRVLGDPRTPPLIKLDSKSTPRPYMDSSSFANNPSSGREVRLLTYIRSRAAAPA